MKPLHTLKNLLSKTTLLMTTAGLIALPLSPSAFAGKQGVFLNNSTYFTLGDVILASGSDKGALRFTLELNNGSDQSIDFNHYGVKIVDSSGTSYTAQLSEKSTATVSPNQTQDFKFISQIPSDLKADQLKVDIFEYDYSSSSKSKDVGALSVAAAITGNQPSNPQIVLNMNEVDSTLPTDALVSFELGKSYRVLQNGAWNVYTDFYVQNLGGSGFKLPSGLIYNLKDSSGLQYDAQTASTTSSTLLPMETTKITVHAPVPASVKTDHLTLQLSKKLETEKDVIGSVDLTTSLQASKLKDTVDYPTADKKGLQIATTWAATNVQTDGLHIQANITLTNNGTSVIAVPSLNGIFQTANGSISLSAVDNATRDAYLSPKDTTVYRFSGVLPTNTSTDDLQIVVLEKNASSSSSTSTQTGSTSNTTTGTTTGTTGTTTGTTTSSTASTSTTSGSTGSTTASTTNASTQTSTNLPVLITDLAGIGNGQDMTPYTDAQDYTIGTPFVVENNNLIDSTTDVALMEMHWLENSDFGYKTVIGKYKITNKGTSSIDLPNFQTDLVNAEGNTYKGSRQTTAASTVLPNTSYVVSYSYIVPASETGDQLAMSLYDANQIGMGSYKVKLQSEVESGPISFYPFQVDVKDYSISALYGNSSYTYKLQMNWDITRQEQVIVDTNFSKMSFDLVDAEGNVLATESHAFTGDQKLTGGKQTIEFTSTKVDQLQSGVSIRMYELIETPNGQAKRLVKVLTTP
jgi:hypothetical protein